MYTLNINGFTPPAPDEGGIIIGREKIWSQNTKRTASAEMVGDIKAIKTTLDISWDEMTQAEVIQLDNAVNNPSVPFIPVTYENHLGNQVTEQFYSAPISFTKKKYLDDGTAIYTGVSLSLIEK